MQNSNSYMISRVNSGLNKLAKFTCQDQTSQEYTKLVSNSHNGSLKSIVGLILFSMMISLSACSSSNQSDSAPESKASATDNSVTTQPKLSEANNNNNSGTVLQGVNATVYKDANCGCCTQWISYANKAGLQSTHQHPQSLNMVKDRYGVPEPLRSCHTTVSKDGYVFEGHIPAKFIAQFIANPPSDAIGLAVPSMPLGSPGMEFEGKFMAYQVFVIHKGGSYKVFASVDYPEQQI